jgi:tetratricopeptide (TPR) repeat protein
MHRPAHSISLLLLAVFVFLIYSNTFQASWHLDDYDNIVTNRQIQIDTLNWQSLEDAFHGGPKAKVWRPVAYITFALNWLVGQNEVFGYHLVNIFIHISCAVLLFFTVRVLFQTPVLRENGPEKVLLTAIFSALLWAAHPIQTQAVTYTVQRMAQLAALFYLLGIYAYLRGRLSESGKNKTGWFGVSGISFLLALGSKENSITFPLALLLCELFFFQPSETSRNRKRFRLISLGIFFTTVLIGSLVFLDGSPLKILARYDGLSFTLKQRLLTETRILVFHLYQIFFPVPSQFSIDHDFVLSDGLFSPWTTFPAILMIGSLIIFSFLLRRRFPLAGFGILFFFLAHTIESSFVPLQLVFEHRNYLPTLFFFVPFSAGICSMLMRYRQQRTGADLYAAIFLGLLLCGLGYATYARNAVWQTEKSLWTDAHRKAPELSRPLHNLAWGHYDRTGRLREAMILYMRALEKKTHRKYERAITYHNIASIYLEAGYYEEAAGYWRKALSILPNHREYRFGLATALLKQKQLDPALAEAQSLVASFPNNCRYRLLKGRILLQQQAARKALEQFRACRRQLDNAPGVSIHIGMALEALGAPLNATVLYRHALLQSPQSLETQLRLAAVLIKRGELSKSTDLIREIVNANKVIDIRRNLQALASTVVPEQDVYRQLQLRISEQLQSAIEGIGR